ncbi:tumor necrosis factor [Ciona intestinalis]
MKINEEIERKVTEINCMACCGKNSERCKKMQCNSDLCSTDPDSGTSHLYNERELHKFISGHAANEYEDAIKVANRVITSKAEGQSLATRIEETLLTTNEHRPYLHMWNKDSQQNDVVAWEHANGAGTTSRKGFEVSGGNITVNSEGVYYMYLHTTFRNNGNPRTYNRRISHKVLVHNSPIYLLAEKRDLGEDDTIQTLDSLMTYVLEKGNRLTIELEKPDYMFVSTTPSETYFGIFKL